MALGVDLGAEIMRTEFGHVTTRDDFPIMTLKP